MDYVIGLALLICPAVLDFQHINASRIVFYTLGSLLIFYSALTRYPFSLVKALPLGVHLALDVFLGLTVMVSPWVAGYVMDLTSPQLVAHFGMGLGMIALVAFTDIDAGDQNAALVDEEEEEEEVEFKKAA